jgi:hypothetical protein
MPGARKFCPTVEALNHKEHQFTHKEPAQKRLGVLFNTLVEKTVEKRGSIFVSSSARDASTACTELVAGT